MMKIYILLFILPFIGIATRDITKSGVVLDEYDGVAVYYNGAIHDVHGRHLSADGYNFGLKWQCVEFVKRFYYQKYNHQFPNSYGHAKDLFDKSLEDIAFNPKRGLMQYRNIRYSIPKIGDILVYDKSPENPFGHVAIICEVNTDNIKIVQQNWGKKTRDTIPLVEFQGIYTVADYNVLGWLRK